MINLIIKLLFFLIVSFQAKAESDSNDKKIKGNLITQINYNFGDKKYNEFERDNISSTLNLNWNIIKNIYIKSSFEAKKYIDGKIKDREEIISYNTRNNNEGLFVDQLYLNYQNKKVDIKLGKFYLNFAKGWKFRNSVWNNYLSLAEYYITDTVGFNFNVTQGEKAGYGKYILGFTTFTDDNKYLDRSLVNNNDSIRSSSHNFNYRQQFGTSYLVSLDIKYDFSELEKLSYHFSYLRSSNEDKPYSNSSSQKAFAASLDYDYPISDNFILDLFLEYVRINHANSNLRRRSNFFISSITLNLYNNWLLTFSHNIHDNKNRTNLRKTNLNSNEISIGYKFDYKYLTGLQIMIGYKQDKIDNSNNIIRDNSVGLLVRNVINF